MTYKTINRAIEAARVSQDPLIYHTGHMLQSTRIHLVDQVAQIEHAWRLEAMELASEEGHPEYSEDMLQAVDRHYRVIEAERGPVRPFTLPNRTASRATNPLIQAAKVARALLTQLGEGQGGEVWPGQYAGCDRWGRVEVVDISMDGETYYVQQIGWGTYPDDPIREVPAAQIRAAERAHP